MGKIKINETASELLDMKNSVDREELDFDDSGELIMPIEHYVNVSAKVENPEARVSVEGAKSAPRKKTASASAVSAAKTPVRSTAAGRRKALALPAGSIGAAVIDEKEKAASAGASASAAKGATKASNTTAKKTSMDGMVRPKTRTVEVTEIETTAEEEFEAHRPREKKEEEPEGEAKPRFSKVKAALIGVGVTLMVAVIGVVAIGFFGKKEVPRCIVQFESNGGTKVESEEVVCGEMVGRPDDPTKDGFTFQSWIYGGSPFNFDQMTIDEDMILVAKWQVEDGVETVKVHFDANGGELAGDDEVVVKKGGKISEPVDPTRTSYEFVGWKLGDEDFDFSQPIDDDITLVAAWEAVAGGSTSTPSGSSSTATPEKPNVESLAAADASMKVGDTKRFDVTCSVVDDSRLQCVAKAPGETTIILRDSLAGKSAQFKLTVTAESTFVTLDNTSVSLSYIGAKATLSATISPSNATNKQLTWSSSNPSAVKVDQNGNIEAVGYGDATITVKTASGMEASCTVTGPKYTPTPPVDPEPEQPEPEGPEDGDE